MRLSRNEFKQMAGAQKRGRFPVAPVAAERTLDGVVFASKREMMRYAALRLEERAGAISHLELQPRFPVLINGCPYCTFRADFAYFRDGEWIVEDVKSRGGTSRDAAYKLRKKAAALAHNISVVEVYG